MVHYQRCKIWENVVSHQFILSFFAVIYQQSRDRQANFSPTCNGVSKSKQASIKTYHFNVLITIIVKVKLWSKNVQRLEQSSTLLTLQAEVRIQCMSQQKEREKIGLFYHAFSSPSTHSGEKTFSHKRCLNHFNC